MLALGLLLAIAPYVTDVGATSAEIRWEGDGELVVGSATIPSIEHDGMHIAELSGLAPDREYGYRVGDEKQSFRTLPAAGSPVRFAVIGDTRTGNDIHAQLSAQIAREAPDFVVNTGDLADDGRVAADWQAFFAAAHPLLSISALLPVVGNHDERGLFNAGDWARYFPHREYAVTAGDVRLIFVDSTVPFESGTEQHAWIAAALDDAKAARARGEIDWIVAAHHYPVYSSGHHGGDPDVRRELLPMYCAAGVDLVLTGHDHIYDRLADGSGITFVVTGGGGAPLYPIHRVPQSVVAQSVHHWMRFTADHTHLTGEAVDLSGNVIDRFEIEPDHPRASAPAPEPPAARAPLIAFALIAAAAAAAWIASGKLHA